VPAWNGRRAYLPCYTATPPAPPPASAGPAWRVQATRAVRAYGPATLRREAAGVYHLNCGRGRRPLDDATLPPATYRYYPPTRYHPTLRQHAFCLGRRATCGYAVLLPPPSISTCRCLLRWRAYLAPHGSAWPRTFATRRVISLFLIMRVSFVICLAGPWRRGGGRRLLVGPANTTCLTHMAMLARGKAPTEHTRMYLPLCRRTVFFRCSASRRRYARTFACASAAYRAARTAAAHMLPLWHWPYSSARLQVSAFPP